MIYRKKSDTMIYIKVQIKTSLYFFEAEYKNLKDFFEAFL